MVVFPLLVRGHHAAGAQRPGPHPKSSTARTASARSALFQPIADGLKMLTKEDIVPRNADKLVHFLAPVVLVIPTLLAYAVLPFGRNLVPIDLDAGILFFFAVGASTELSVFMAGWSSRNKYSLLGAMRAIAQMISYEIPLILSSVTVIMMAGSLSLVEIVKQQAGYLRLGAALVRVHAVGTGRVHHLPDCGAGGIQPLAVRLARRRIGNHRRASHRIFRLQIRAVFPGGIPRHVRHERPGGHAVPRRLARAAARSWTACPPTSGFWRSCWRWSVCSSGFAGRCRACAWISC